MEAPGMHERPGRMLLRYDRRILQRTLAAVFTRWHERILALLVLMLVVMGFRGWIGGFAQPAVSAVLAAAGFAAGIAAGRTIAARLAYHDYDGPLAAEALRRGAHRHYLLGWHLPLAAIVAALTLITQPAQLAASLPGYALGAALALGLPVPDRAGLQSRAAAHGLRTLASDPRAGAAAAGVLTLALLAMGPLSDPAARPALAAIVATLLALALTMLDPARIRFLLQSGHSPGRMIVRQGRGLFWFTGLATLAAFAFGPQTGVAVALGCALASLLMVVRLLAYAVHRKRPAELLVTAMLGLLGFVGFTMPLLLPLVGALLLWRLHNRAAANRWILPCAPPWH